MSSRYRVLKDKTTANLGNAGVYTSNVHFVEQYNHIRGLVSSDQGGTLSIQQSDDNTTFVLTNSITVTANTPNKFDEPCYANYVRLVYTNGATPTTSFYLCMNADPFQ